MTKEELMQLPVEELTEKVLKLEKEVKEKGESVMFWSQKKDEVQTKFDRFKEAVRGVALLVD